jgi:toxin ParE1/3/4
LKPVTFDSDATDEINNAVSASPGPAAFRSAISDALALIAAHPQIAAKIGRTRARQYLLRTYPYSIVYVETPNVIRVIAFPHHKRRQGYWRRRLPKL